MSQVNEIVVVILALATAFVLFRRWMVEALIEEINKFRGGPRTPMHPSPAGDAALLRRLPKKTETYHC